MPNSPRFTSRTRFPGQSLVGSGAFGFWRRQLAILLVAAFFCVQAAPFAACAKLADFINSAQNYIDHGNISAAQGQAWINSAANVGNTLGCTNNPCT